MDPGIKENPYSEVVRTFPGEIKTVKVPAESGVFYGIYYADGTKLTIEDPDAYVVYNEKTYEPQEGVLSLDLEHAYPVRLPSSSWEARQRRTRPLT
jgi:hypothetical protein